MCPRGSTCVLWRCAVMRSIPLSGLAAWTVMSELAAWTRRFDPAVWARWPNREVRPSCLDSRVRSCCLGSLPEPVRARCLDSRDLCCAVLLSETHPGNHSISKSLLICIKDQCSMSIYIYRNMWMSWSPNISRIHDKIYIPYSYTKGFLHLFAVIRNWIVFGPAMASKIQFKCQRKGNRVTTHAKWKETA